MPQHTSGKDKDDKGKGDKPSSAAADVKSAKDGGVAAADGKASADAGWVAVKPITPKHRQLQDRIHATGAFGTVRDVSGLVADFAQEKRKVAIVYYGNAKDPNRREGQSDWRDRAQVIADFLKKKFEENNEFTFDFSLINYDDTIEGKGPYYKTERDAEGQEALKSTFDHVILLKMQFAYGSHVDKQGRNAEHEYRQQLKKNYDKILHHPNTSFSVVINQSFPGVSILKSISPKAPPPSFAFADPSHNIDHSLPRNSAVNVYNLTVFGDKVVEALVGRLAPIGMESTSLAPITEQDLTGENLTIHDYGYHGIASGAEQVKALTNEIVDAARAQADVANAPAAPKAPDQPLKPKT